MTFERLFDTLALNVDKIIFISRNLAKDKFAVAIKFESGVVAGDNYVAILSGRRPESCEQTGICRMDESTYVVEADGSVYPCDFYVLDAYRAGNFNEDRIDAVDQKMKALGFTERSRTLPSECQSCRYLSLCRGGCYRSRLTNENGLDETLQADGRNYFCESFRMFFDHSQERLKKIADFFTAWPRFTMGS